MKIGRIVEFMKTPRRLSCLVGWIGRCACGIVALAVCASAVAADGSKNVVSPPAKAQPVRPTPQKQFYMFSSTSAIPQPIARVNAPIPTTAIPVTVFRHGQ
jgi:hypothetical protein